MRDEKPLQSVFEFHPPSAPFTGKSWTTVECSKAGAEQATAHCRRQCDQLLALYAQHGDLTDAESATLMGLERSSVIPRRRELMKRGLVQEVGTRDNVTSGIANTTWGRV